MDEGVEDEEYYILEEEYVPPKHPKLERIKRQLFTCSGPILGAVAAGICSNDKVHHYGEYKLTLGWDDDYISWFPLVGEVPGIVLAAPLLYFLGRRYALIVSQFLFLMTLLVKEYFHEQQSGHRYYLRLQEEFMCLVGLHMCVRLYVIVTVVYLVEVPQPSHRAPLLAATYCSFVLGLYYGRFDVQKRPLLPAVVAQAGSMLLALMAFESPYWLALKGNEERAQATFRWLRAGDDDADELTALLESTSPDAERPPLLTAFGSALAKVAFLHMGADSACRVFMTRSSIPQYFFRTDNAFEHQIDWTEETPPQMYVYPISGSFVFLVLSPFVGRRPLYLASVVVSLLVFYYRQRVLSFNMLDEYVLSAELCYFLSHVGAIQIMLLVSGEIFPMRVREFGVAISELMQFGLLYADSNYADSFAESRNAWSTYSTARFTLIILGVILTFVFLPETINKTLVEVEIEGAKMAPVFLAAAVAAENVDVEEGTVGEE